MLHHVGPFLRVRVLDVHCDLRMGEGSEQISESISAVEAVASRQPFSSCWESQSQVSLNVGDFLTIFSWFSQYPDEERKVWDHPSSSCLEERRH